jgi:hypothetical protein
MTGARLKTETVAIKDFTAAAFLGFFASRFDF